MTNIFAYANSSLEFRRVLYLSIEDSSFFFLFSLFNIFYLSSQINSRHYLRMVHYVRSGYLTMGGHNLRSSATISTSLLAIILTIF
jgi:hypothetical protein